MREIGVTRGDEHKAMRRRLQFYVVREASKEIKKVKRGRCARQICKSIRQVK